MIFSKVSREVEEDAQKDLEAFKNDKDLQKHLHEIKEKKKSDNPNDLRL
jgi:hypothetical protein